MIFLGIHDKCVMKFAFGSSMPSIVAAARQISKFASITYAIRFLPIPLDVSVSYRGRIYRFGFDSYVSRSGYAGGYPVRYLFKVGLVSVRWLKDRRLTAAAARTPVSSNQLARLQQ